MSRRLRSVAAASLAGLCLAAPGPSTAAAPVGAAPTTAYQPPDHLDQWWYDAMDLAELQERTDGGKGVTVAVLDGYLDTSVPDLKGADVTIKPGCLGDETPRDMGDEASHGTAMTTAIVGQGTGNGPGGRGILGVAPEATVNFYSINEDHDDGEADCNSYGTGEMMIRAIEEDGADIVTIQAVGGLLGALQDSIKKATELGAVVVVSSGNRSFGVGVIAPPANSPGVVAIVAGDRDFRPWVDNPKSGSLKFSDVDFLSPGVDTPLGAFVDGAWVSGEPRTGTSGATAIAAGAFALAKAAWPDATGNQLVQAAVRSTRDGDKPRWADGYGWGGIRIPQMIERDPAGWPDENPLAMSRGAIARFSPDDYQDPASEPDDAADQAETGSSADAVQQPAASTTDEGGPPVGALAVGGLIGLLVLAGAVVLARRRHGSAT